MLTATHPNGQVRVSRRLLACVLRERPMIAWRLVPLAGLLLELGYDRRNLLEVTWAAGRGESLAHLVMPWELESVSAALAAGDNWSPFDGSEVDHGN